MSLLPAGPDGGGRGRRAVRVIKIDRPALRRQAAEEERQRREERATAAAPRWGRTLSWGDSTLGAGPARGGTPVASVGPRPHRRRRRSRTTSEEPEGPVAFADNVVVSAKYNVWNFAARVLAAQLQRPSNVYFLFIAVLQSIRDVSNTNGVPTILLPLLIVFICSAIKEALEDRERHRADAVTNNRRVLALNADGVWAQRKWGELQVGDLVRVRDGETVPADLFLLSVEEQDDDKDQQQQQQQHDEEEEEKQEEEEEEEQAEQQDDEKEDEAEEEKAVAAAAAPEARAPPRAPGTLAYIETKSLDGETNLKIRSAIPLVAHLAHSGSSLRSLRGVVECEQPNNRINSFEGSFTVFLERAEATALGLVGKKPNAAPALGDPSLFEMVTRANDSVSVRCPITAKQMILRSCVVQNTRAVTGMVIFTGHETKVFCSNTEPVVKSSSVEKRLNGLIIGVVLIQQLVCFLGALLGAYWMWTKGDTHWYLRTHVRGSPKWNPGGVAPWHELIKLHLRYFIIMQNFVPISLNVSLEFVKYWQAYFMEQDLEMYDPVTNSPAMVRSSALNEDLGRVHHIFTDKTGTLTMNLMLFRYCMIGEKHYGGVLQEDEMEASLESTTEADEPGANSVRYVDFDPTDLFTDLHNGGAQADRIRLFLRHLALCHTLIPAKPLSEMCTATVPEYSASSPDEQALVSAASFCNVRFVHRTPTAMTLIEAGTESPLVYKILNLLEFDSDRKRMTVIVESPNGDIELLCKGADNVILERLTPNQANSEMVDEVYNQLSLYAKCGMRTLCLAHKSISRVDYDKWCERFNAAHSSMEELVKRRRGLANAIDPLMNEIEQDLQLLGVTAVQDKLQTGVPRTLALVQETSIKVWTLTGDKMETAINIGYACNLLSNSMAVKQLSGEDYISTLKSLQEIKAYHRTIASRLSQQESPPKRRRKRKHSRRSSSFSFMQSIQDFFGQNEVSEKRSKNRRGTRRSGKTTGHRPSSHSVELESGVYDSDEIVDEANDDEYGSLLGRKPLHGISQTGHHIDIAVVIDGSTLEFALRPRLRQVFYDVTKLCKSVICCRVSPKQKSDVVEFIREFEPDSITLAIGDGANDVGMIQAAHIGVGISGQEGTQAVNASDYAIAQFRFLQRLLFVHGRWAYRRVAKLMSYMLYKNVTYVLTTFWFGCFCGFSGQPLIIDIAAQSFNLLYTSLPLVIFAVFDQDISSESASKFPYLYSLGQKNVLLGRKVFWPWILNGIWHSVIIFFFSALCYEGELISRRGTAQLSIPATDGKGNDIVTLGFVVFTNLVIVVNLKLCLETFLITWQFLATVGVSILLWFVVGNIVSSPQSRIVQAIGEMLYVQASPTFWILSVLVVTVSLLRDLLWKIVRRLNYPSSYHILQEREMLSLRNSPRSLDSEHRKHYPHSASLWKDTDRATTVDYSRLFRTMPPFGTEHDSFMRSSPLAESLIPPSGQDLHESMRGVRARGSFHVLGNTSTTWQGSAEMYGNINMLSQLGGESTPLGSDHLRRDEYHGYAFSEDENVDSDVEAATARAPQAPFRKTATGTASANTADVHGGSGRTLKKMLKSVRGHKNA